MDSGRPVGIVGFTGDCITLLYVIDSAPEQTRHDLLKAVIADAVNRGASFVSIHTLDIDGKGHGICKELGFTGDGIRACSQRAGMINLKKTFRLPITRCRE